MAKVIIAKRTNVNPTSGLQRWKISPEDAGTIIHWLGGTDQIRKFRQHKDGGFGFSTGCGYAIVDADLLGGTGDGKAERKFQDDTGFRVTTR